MSCIKQFSIEGNSSNLLLDLVWADTDEDFDQSIPSIFKKFKIFSEGSSDSFPKRLFKQLKNFSVLQSLSSFCFGMYYWNFVCADKWNVLCADICKLWLLPKLGILTCTNSGWRLWLGRRFTWKQWARVLSRDFVSSVMKLSKNVNLVLGYD